MGKKWRIALAAGGLLVLLALVLGLEGWDAEGQAARAFARIERETGWSLQARSARLVPLRGLVLEGVTGRLPAGRGELAADRLLLEHRPAALLAGRLELERLVIRRPRLKFSEPPPPAPRPTPVAVPAAAPARPIAQPLPPPAPQDEPGDEDLRFRLGAVLVEDGLLVVTRAGEARGLRVEGLRLELETEGAELERGGSLLRSLSASGRFSASAVELPVGSLGEVGGELRLREGRLSLPGLSFSNTKGDFEAELEVQLGTTPLRYSASVRADPLDLHALFDSPERQLFGAARFEARVRGVGTAPGSLEGDGTVTVEGGRLPSFPILDHLEAGLRRVSLHHAEHGPILAAFSLGEGALELAPFAVDAAELHVEGSGRVGYDGALDLSLELSSPPDGVSLRGVPEDLVRLMTVEGGRLAIPLVVEGSTERPRARADAAVLAARSRARGRAVDEEALRLRLDEIFGLQG